MNWPLEYGSHGDMIRAPSLGRKSHIIVFLHVSDYLIELRALFLLVFASFTDLLDFFLDLRYLLLVDQSVEFLHSSHQTHLVQPPEEYGVNVSLHHLHPAPAIPFPLLDAVLCAVGRLGLVDVVQFHAERLEVLLHFLDVRIEVASQQHCQILLSPELLLLQHSQLLFPDLLVFRFRSPVQMHIDVHERLIVASTVFEVLHDTELEHFAWLLLHE